MMMDQANYCFSSLSIQNLASSEQNKRGGICRMTSKKEFDAWLSTLDVSEKAREAIARIYTEKRKYEH
jgi:hypothetical protein